MNKWIPALMTAALLTAAGTVCAAEAPDVTGEWYTGMYGIPVTLNLQEGTFSLEVLGETIDGTWEQTDEGIVLSDDAGLLTVDGDFLTLEDADLQVVFSREQVETFTPGEIRQDAAVEEFAGTWNSTYVNYLGMIMNGAEAGLDMTASVQGTDVTLNSESMSLQDRVIPFAYESGSLKMALQPEAEASGEEAAETTEAAEADASVPDMNMSLSLLDDGTLAMDMEVYGMEVIFYMEKAEEPAPAETSEAAEETADAAETTETAEETEAAVEETTEGA